MQKVVLVDSNRNPMWNNPYVPKVVKCTIHEIILSGFLHLVHTDFEIEYTTEDNIVKQINITLIC